MDRWTLESQKITKRTARKHGETWTSADLELLAAFADESITELASTLGRTYLATATMKSLVAAGKIASDPRVITTPVKINACGSCFMIHNGECL